MSIYEDVAAAIVRKRRAELESLPEDRRRTVVTSIIKKLRTKSEDELIQYMSARKPGLTPEMATSLNQAQQMRRVTESAPPMERFGPGAVRLPRGPVQDIERAAELQQLGVETGTPLPAGDIQLGFGADQAESLRNVLSQQYQTPVTVFRRGQDVLYLDPTDKVIKRAEPNMLGAAGHGLPIAGDVAGTVLGGMGAATITRNPLTITAGESAGSAAGAGTGEFLRLATGKFMGIHDLTWPDVYKRAGKVGAAAGVTTGVVGGAVVTTKGLRNFIKGGIFTHDEALKHGMSTQQADMVLDEINKIIGRKGAVKGTLYKRTDDVTIGSQESRLRGKVEYADDFRQRDLTDQLGAVEAFERIAPPRSSAQTLNDMAEQQVKHRAAQAKGVVARTKNEFRTQMDDISRVRKKMAGQPTRNTILEKRKAFKEAEDKAWEDMRAMGKFDPQTETFGINIPIGKEARQVRQIYERQADTAITNVPQTNIFRKGAKGADLADYQREISRLKTRMREKSKYGQDPDLDIRDLNKTIKALVKDRDDALVKSGRTDLLNEIKNAEQKTAEFHDIFEKSVIGDLTEKTSKGTYKIKDPDFVDTILRGGGDEADQLLRVINDQPTLMNKWKEALADDYKTNVIAKMRPLRGGKFEKEELAERSLQWFDNNEEVLSRFFTKQELNQIRKTGDIAMVVKKQVEQEKRILKNAEQRWGKGKLASLDPENLIKFVTNEAGSFTTPNGRGIQASISKVKYVKGITRNHPEVWDRFKSDFALDLRKSTFDPETGFIKPKQLSDIVHKKGDVIEAIMGKEYRKNLETINDTVQILNRQGKILSDPESREAILQTFRAGPAPPLTRRGRAFTAIVRLDNRQAHKAMARAILNPEDMAKMADVAEHNVITRRTLELLASVGLITDDEFQARLSEQ